MGAYTQAGPSHFQPLLDAHVHLQDDLLYADRSGVLERAGGQGVQAFLCNGSCEDDWARVAELAREHSSIVPCFGLHPWYVAERSDAWLSRLEEHLNAMDSAVGEIGLDRWLEPRDEALQEVVFREQLRLARRLRRPVMVHCVRAWDWLLRVFKEEPPPAAGVLIHAFGGSAEIAQALTQTYGAYLSFAGNCLDPRKRHRNEVLRAIPRDRLLLETDAPDLLPPESHRAFILSGKNGKPANEPANLRRILAGIAIILDLPEDELAAQTWQNGQNFLRDWHAREKNAER